MLIIEDKAGTKVDSGLLRQLTKYDKIYSTGAPMKFYPLDAESLVDVHYSADGKNLMVWVYPFNLNNIKVIIKEKESALYSLINSALYIKGKTRSMFTVNISNMSIITKEDFKSLVPINNRSHNAFIFDTEISGGFPSIYVQPEEIASDFKDILAVQAYSSYVQMKPANHPTEFGKNITYILTNSALKGTFVGDKFPNLISIDIPHSSSEELPEGLDTKELEIFAEKCELYKVKRTNKGFTVEEDTALAVIPKKEEENETEYVDEYSDKATSLRIQKSVLEKNSINLSEVLGLGVSQTISALPITDTIITINLDIHGIFKKMCLKEGKFYFVLIRPNEDWSFYLGEESVHFVECTEETYPKKYLM